MASTSDKTRITPVQRITALVSTAGLEVGLTVVALAAVSSALGDLALLTAIIVTVCAAGVVGRAVLQADNRIEPRLGASARPRLVLVVATFVSVVGATSSGAQTVVAAGAFMVAVASVVLERHVRRILGARITLVARLPGVAPVPSVPRLQPLVLFGGLLASVVGAWSVELGLSDALWVVLVPLCTLPLAALAQLGRRRVLAGIAQEKSIGPALAAYAPEIIVYTARPDDASYQVAMWMPYLQRSGKRIIVVTRDALPARALAEITDVPVVQRRRLVDLDTVVTPATRAAFYVNASSGNGAFVRYHQLTHVYLGHGDSDKPPSYNPTHAMFDRVFAAGPAATRRYAAHGVRIALSKFDVVGRPQVEGVHPAIRSVAEADPPTVLYAPTWRGHVEETLLYSLPVGEQIVSALLTRGAIVIFRPHPFSYAYGPDRVVIERIHRLLASDARSTGRPHRWGPAAETDLGILDCMNASDAMVSDVSSVVSDYLFSSKPFAMVAVSTGVDTFADEYPIAEAAYILDGALANLDAVLDAMLGDDPMAAHRTSVKADYLGDYPAEGYADVFVDAVRAVVDDPHETQTRGIEAAEEEAEAPGTTRRSIRRRVAALARDAFINGLAALTVVLAAVGSTVLPAMVAALLTLAAIVWARRRVVRRPRRWRRLIATEVLARVLLATGLPVAAAASGAEVSSPLLLATVLLVASLLAETTVRTALGRQGLEASGLPGLRTTVGTVVPWGTSTLTSWLVLLVSWVTLSVGGSTVMIAVLAALQLLVLLDALVRGLIRMHRSVSAEDQLVGELTAYAPAFAVYFASTVGIRYQLGMWLPYLQRIGLPFVVITRTVPMLRQLQAAIGDAVPIIHRPTLRSLEDVTVPSMTAAFYVNNAVRNTHFIERRQLTHVWLNHGDSEKPACYNPVHAIYDVLFAAGQAGIDRYARHGVDIPQAKFQIVGRPQVEVITKATVPICQIAAPTVLYAPTWKGPFADSRVYSLPIGADIVRALLARGATVIFRAHPFNYRFADAAALIAEIGRLLEADRVATGREHRWGPAAEAEMTVEDCFNASDAMISDVSAVVSDYLQADKPFSIVSVGRTPEQLVDDAPAAQAAYVLREDLSNLEDVLDELLSTDGLAPVRSETRIYYLGDFPPATYADGFVDAARAVIDATG